MTDIAKIGFGVETSQLEKGVTSLNKLSSSSKSASSNAMSLGTAMGESAKVFAGAVAGMTKGIHSLVTATKGATVQQISAAKEASDFAAEIYKSASAQDKLAVSTRKVTAAIKGQVTQLTMLQRVNRLTGVTGLSGKSAEESFNTFRTGMSGGDFETAVGATPRAFRPNKFNTANLAAQFQDIAVTSAMGMNPLTIAMQQGVQISAVLDSMEGGVQGLKDAFKSIISPMALATLGIVGLVAALIQAVDWSKTGKSILNGLASAFEFLAEHAETVMIVLTGLTIKFLLLNKAIILTALSAVANFAIMAASAMASGAKFAAGLIIAGGPLVWLITGITIVLAVLSTFRDELKNLIGFDVLNSISTGINKIIGFFRGLGQVLLKYTGPMGIFNMVRVSFSDGATGILKDIKGIMNESLNTDYVGKAAEGMKTGLSKTSEAFKGWADKITDSSKAAKKAREAWEDLTNEFNRSIADLEHQKSLLGATAYQTEFLTSKYNMLSRAKEGDIKLTGQQLDYINKSATAYAKLSTEVQRLTFMADAEKGFAKDNDDIQLREKLIGATAYQTEFLTTKYNLLNQAKQSGINLDKTELGYIEEASAAKAKYAVKIQILEERFNFAKDATKGFFQDMKQGLREGESLWNSFGNAITNVLDKILDKMLDVGVDLIFSGMKSSPDVTEAGGFSSFFSTTATANAKGNAFTENGITPFAKGGAFTNGTYDSPTMFKFAKGGKFGVMGEAGPEAVMPSTRGPDGSLGVRAEGTGGGSNVTVNVTNNSNAQTTVEQRETSQGVEIDVLIDQLVGDKIARPGTASNTALNVLSNRNLVTR